MRLTIILLCLLLLLTGCMTVHQNRNRITDNPRQLRIKETASNIYYDTRSGIKRMTEWRIWIPVYKTKRYIAHSIREELETTKTPTGFLLCCTTAP